MNIRLVIAKVKPEQLADLSAAWLAAYEAKRETHPGNWNAPDLIKRNALELAKILAADVDRALVAAANDIAREVAKQAFAIGAGRAFPEIQVSVAAAGGDTTSSAEPREKVQVIERDPETLEITRTVTK